MNRIEAIAISELSRGGWNGSPIQKLEDCDECLHARDLVLEDGNNGGEICAWGVAWKRLNEPTFSRSCTKKTSKQPDFHVLWQR